MKKILTLLSVLVIFVLIQTLDKSNIAHSSNSGAVAGHTGSPADGSTCNTSGCHTGNAVLPITGVITSNIPPSGYIPGTVYTMTASVNQAGINRFGFQISPQANNGAYLGTLQVTSPTTTKIVGGKYITHTSGGTSATANSRTWNFNWTAPPTGTGNVTFYGAFNFANNNASTSGDNIKTSSLVVTENLTSGLVSNADPYSSVLFPVPANDQTTLRLYLAEAASLQIDLITLSGHIAAELYRVQNQQPGNHEISMPLPADLSDGLYFLRISGEQGIAMKKLMVNR